MKPDQPATDATFGPGSLQLLETLQRSFERILVFDREGMLVFANHEEAKALLGKHWTSFLATNTAFHSDGITPLAMEDHAIQRALRGLETASRMIQIKNEESGARWFLSRGFPLRDQNGELDGAVSLSMDLTRERVLEDRLREKESQLLTIQRTAPTRFVVLDLNGRILRDISGEASGGNELLNHEINDLLPNVDHAPYLSCLARASEGMVELLEYDRLGLDLELQLGALNPSEIFGVLRDLTRRRAAERKVGRSYADLANVARAGVMGEMASAMAHQINQPLSAITLYSRAISRRLEQVEGVPADILEALDSISNQALRAGETIRELRRFAVAKAPQFKAYRLLDLAEDVFPLLDMEARESQVRVVLDIPDSLSPVRVDQVQLQQVLLNLVRNAVESIGRLPRTQRDARSTVRVLARQLSAGELLVSVQDQGAGLMGQEPDEIFDAFHSGKSGGAGLGLPMSRSIIELHGGRIWASEEPDGNPGMSFNFTLPAMESTGGRPDETED